MLTIDPRPRRDHGGAEHLARLERADQVHVEHAAEHLERHVLDRGTCRPDPGGWSMPALFTSTARRADLGRARVRGRPRAPRGRSRRPVGATAGRWPRARSAVNAAEGGTPVRSSATTARPRRAAPRTRPGPSCPSAPVTTATRPSSGQRLSRPRPAPSTLERDIVVGARAAPSTRAARARPVELVRRQAVAGRLHGDVLAPQHVAHAGQVARGDELLAHLEQRARPRSRTPFFTPSPSATRVRRRSRTIFRMPTGSSEKAWSVPFIGAVQGEVLLDDPRAQHVGRHRHGDAVVVARRARRPRRETARGRWRSRAGSSSSDAAGIAAVHWRKRAAG